MARAEVSNTRISLRSKWEAGLRGDIQQVQDILQSVDDLSRRGAFQQAIPLGMEACDLARRSLGNQHTLLAVSLNRLAGLYKSLQYYEEAEPLYLESLQILRGNSPDSRSELTKCLNNLAELYRQVGAYDQALPLFEEALEILAELGQSRGLGAATVRQNLGLAYAAIGSYDRSASLLEESLRQSIAVLGENDPDIATTKDNLGFVYREQGEYERAAELHRQALEIYRNTIGEQNPDVSACLNNLALTYQRLGRLEEALPLCKQAIEIDRKVFGANSASYATSVHNLGFLYLCLGDNENAEPYLREALDIRRSTLGEGHPEVRSSLAVLAELFASTSREEDALDLMEQRAAMDEHVLAQVFSSFSGDQKMNHLATLHTRYNIFVSLVMKTGSRLGSVIQRGLTFILRRKGLSIEAMEIPSGVFASGSGTQSQELIRLRTQIYRTMIAGPKQESLWDYDDRLSQDFEALEHLEIDLMRQMQGVSFYDRLQRVTLENVANTLPAGSILVEYVHLQVFDFSRSTADEESKWRPPHYLAFILPAGTPEQVRMIDLGEAEPIDAVLTQFRSHFTGEAPSLAASSPPDPIESPSDDPSRHVESGTARTALNMDIGKKLRALIFDPIASLLDEGKRLILAPDGKLSLLPFEILPLDDERYLIDEYQLSYLNVGREILRFARKAERAASQSVVIASPDYDLGTKEQDFVDRPTGSPVGNLRGLVRHLPAAAQEGEDIAGLLNAQLFKGETALSSVLRACRSPLVLHIATHAYFQTEYFPMSGMDIYPSDMHLNDVADLPFGRYQWFWRRTERSPLMRSCLLFAGFNTWLRGGNPPMEAEEGIVTGADILNMDLRHTELVVLSACETGVGDIVDLEGVFGLRRAFILAGVQTLVSSLWQVPDYHTRELMSSFYEHLLSGLPREQALREAQLAMKANYPDPLYWGAFICQGAPGILSIRPAAAVARP